MAHRHCAWPYEPAGVTSAQMNMFFAAAMMIIDRNAMLDQFREDRLSDPAALAMIERIEIEADPKYDVGGDATRHHARVELIAEGRPPLLRARCWSGPAAPAIRCRRSNSRRNSRHWPRPVLPAERIPKIIAAVVALESTNARALTGLATTVAAP